MIVAGIGFASQATTADIVGAVRAALSANGYAPSDLVQIATIATKRDSLVVVSAARMLGVPIAFLETPALAAAAGRCVSRSARSLATSGLPSVSEAAALAVAGGATELVAPRRIIGSVTCALARLCEEIVEAQP